MRTILNNFFFGRVNFFFLFSFYFLSIFFLFSFYFFNRACVKVVPLLKNTPLPKKLRDNFFKKFPVPFSATLYPRPVVWLFYRGNLLAYVCKTLKSPVGTYETMRLAYQNRRVCTHWTFALTFLHVLA